MIINGDKQIKIPLPFLHDKTVLYVDSRLGISHNYIEYFKYDLLERFNGAGYSFLFLPDLVKNISPEILQYQFPGHKCILLVEDLYHNIQEIAHLDDKNGFIYKQNDHIYFRPIPESPDQSIKAAIDDFISSLNHVYMEEEHTVLFRKIKPFKKRNSEFYNIDQNWDLPKQESSITYHDFVDEERLAPKAQAVIDAWEEIERRFGITIEDLDIILGYRIKLSRLILTTSNRIFLPDLEGTPEVKLDDLTKALYFFYLRHPKGAAFKELLDYEDEIYRIYMSITGRDDIDAIRKSVSGLVAPYSTVRDSCVSRIKKAFRDIVGDRIAKYYYIDGRAGDTRKVSIDRDLVIWEH
jgi:hypothetical protein